MTSIEENKRLLLISNSTLYGRGYLDHVEEEIRDLLGRSRRIVFVPYALHDRRAYASLAQERFQKMDLPLVSIHDVSNQQRAIADADAIFIGGGNTFRLLKALHEQNLIDPIRRRVRQG